MCQEEREMCFTVVRVPEDEHKKVILRLLTISTSSDSSPFLRSPSPLHLNFPTSSLSPGRSLLLCWLGTTRATYRGYQRLKAYASYFAFH